MDIASLAEALHEDLNSSLTQVRLGDEWSLVLVVETDDWTGAPVRRQFELRCSSVVESRCSPGAFESLGFFSSHPLLLSHTGPQSQLFFSSAPQSAGDVFLTAHSCISESLDGWRSPEDILVHEPFVFPEILAGGHGSLARGPSEVIDRLATALSSMLDVNSVQSYTASKSLVAVTFDSQWVICEAVQVVEIGS